MSKFAKLKEIGNPSLKSLANLITYKEGGSYFIKGEPGDGLTALLYEVIKDLSYLGIVILFDFKDSARLDRLKDANLDNIILAKVSSVEDCLTLLCRLDKSEKNIFIALDGPEVFGKIDKDWDVAYFPENLAKSIRRILPSSMIILAEKTSRRASSFFWNDVIEIQKLKRIVIDRTPFGHVAKISVDSKEEKIYVDYKLGRLSARYDEAMDLINKGEKKPTSVFGSSQGLWNYVLEENED